MLRNDTQMYHPDQKKTKEKETGDPNYISADHFTRRVKVAKRQLTKILISLEPCWINTVILYLVKIVNFTNWLPSLKNPAI